MTTARHKIYILLFCSMVLSSSCVHVYYAPNSVHMPVLKEKNDIRLSLAYVETSDGYDGARGGELQFAYAVSPAIGVLGNVFSTVAYPDESGASGSGTYAEFGAGYYKPFGGKSNWVFESYGGFGLGGVKNEYENGGHSKTGIFKFFVQPSLSFSSKVVEFSLGSRLSFANIHIKEKNILVQTGQTFGSDGNLDMLYLEQHPFSVMWEPGANLAIGFRKLKPFIGVSYSFNISNPDFPQATATGSLGLRFMLNTVK